MQRMSDQRASCWRGLDHRKFYIKFNLYSACGMIREKTLNYSRFNFGYLTVCDDYLHNILKVVAKQMIVPSSWPIHNNHVIRRKRTKTDPTESCDQPLNQTLSSLRTWMTEMDALVYFPLFNLSESCDTKPLTEAAVFIWIITNSLWRLRNECTFSSADGVNCMRSNWTTYNYNY